MKFGMIFPGYGSQFVGMGKDLYDDQRLVQEYFEEAATCLSINFVKLCFASSEIELAKPPHAYTSLFLMSASAAGLLKEKNIIPEVVASVDVVSWYSSLFAAGSISLPDGLYMLNKLGTVYEELLQKEAFSAIFIKDSSKAKVAQLCKQASDAEFQVSLAAIAPTGFLIAGDIRAIEKVEALVSTTAGITYEAADIGGGLYMSRAEEVALQVNAYLEKIDFKTPIIPVISPINGKLLKKSEELKEISRIIFVQQLDQLASIQKVAQYERICIALPARRLRPEVSALVSDEVIDTVENKIEFDAFVAKYQPAIDVPEGKSDE